MVAYSATSGPARLDRCRNPSEGSRDTQSVHETDVPRSRSPRATFTACQGGFVLRQPRAPVASVHVDSNTHLVVLLVALCSAETGAPLSTTTTAAGIIGVWWAWWSAWALLGWGLGVSIHGLVVRMSRPRGSGPTWEERQIEKVLSSEEAAPSR